MRTVSRDSGMDWDRLDPDGVASHLVELFARHQVQVAQEEDGTVYLVAPWQEMHFLKDTIWLEAAEHFQETLTTLVKTEPLDSDRIAKEGLVVMPLKRPAPVQEGSTSALRGKSFNKKLLRWLFPR
jgi:hypothetical protein